MAALRKVALAQHRCGGAPGTILAGAKKEHAEIVCSPEMSSNGHRSFDCNDQQARVLWQKEADRLDGAYVDRFRKAARGNEIHVVATFLEAAAPKPFTRHF